MEQAWRNAVGLFNQDARDDEGEARDRHWRKNISTIDSSVISFVRPLSPPPQCLLLLLLLIVDSSKRGG